MSSWPYIVLLLTISWLCWGVHLTGQCILNCMLWNVTMTLHSTAHCHQMTMGGMSDWMSAWPKGSPNVKLTWCSTAPGHQMPPGGGVKTIKMAWDLCSSPLCILFYPCTMFENPMPKLFSQQSRKAIII